MREIARCLFKSLNHDTFYGVNSTHYIVLNDQNYDYDFYASTEAEAIKKFKESEECFR